MKQIDINHALAHLRSAKQIVADNLKDMSPQDISAFGDALQDAEKVLKRLPQ